MTHFKSPHSTRPRGFSLIELLVVIAIMALMGSIALVYVKNGGAGNSAPQGASNIASSVFSQARTEAIMRNVKTRVVVDTVSETNSENFLRRLTIVYASTDANGQTNWNQACKWIMIPNRIYYDKDYSLPHGTEKMAIGPETGDWDYYEFLTNGQANNSTANASVLPQFVVSPGQLVNGVFKTSNEKARYGFVLHRMGRVAYFQDVEAIVKP